jgi:hypothetical protein
LNLKNKKSALPVPLAQRMRTVRINLMRDLFLGSRRRRAALFKIKIIEKHVVLHGGSPFFLIDASHYTPFLAFVKPFLNIFSKKIHAQVLAVAHVPKLSHTSILSYQRHEPSRASISTIML